jgi:hypothetical protein
MIGLKDTAGITVDAASPDGPCAMILSEYQAGG